MSKATVVIAYILLIAGIATAQPGERPAYALVVHGGAGAISKDMPDSIEANYRAGLNAALDAGEAVLASGGAAEDAVVAAIVVLENDPLFNAGRGAVLNAEGAAELDVSLMRGSDKACGAAAAIRTVKNPITLARAIMERSPHVFFAAEGAERFAEASGLEIVDPEYFVTERRREAWRRREAEDAKGTVGAVALDRDGNLAAGTSTGGTSFKTPGRVGDSPVIGAGTYADNATCAVSSTGHGELFIRNVVAFRIAALMAFANLSLDDAANEVVRKLLAPGDGGVIAVDARGNVATPFNTEGMFRGAAIAGNERTIAIWNP
ncbi:MAG: beta-aspartyl-peptidase [Ignavibacteriales bacterium]|nr:beta-aspartyl-peptidase [Ignavibacteriales bacterium]